MRWNIRAALSISESENTIQWCYWPDGYKLARQIGLPHPLVFDADHNIIDDVNLDRENRLELETLLNDSAENCRLIVSGSRSMLNWYAKRGQNQLFWLRNAVDLERFPKEKYLSTETLSASRPRIAYVGVLSRWINYELLLLLATKRMDWDFLIVGPNYKSPNISGLVFPPNVLFLGERDANYIPPFLVSCDLGLSLYVEDYESWLDGDSMKIFEYLAAGLPVVSTPYHPNLNSDFSGLIDLAKGVEEFEGAINNLLNRSPCEQAQWDLKRQNFLMNNTWHQRGEEAMHLIQQILTNRNSDSI